MSYYYCPTCEKEGQMYSGGMAPPGWGDRSGEMSYECKTCKQMEQVGTVFPNVSVSNADMQQVRI